MAYFDDHASFYSTSSTREEFNTYQFLNQTTATEEANYQFEGHSYGTLTDLWNKFEQPEPTVGSPTALPATAGDELLALATSYPDQTDGYGQPPYSSYYWPEVCQQAQSYDSGSLSHGFSSASMAVPEPFAANPTPSSAPLGYWGENQSGPSTSTFYTQSVDTYDQPSTGPTRTESTRRFQPYGMSRARLNEHRNAEAGPSTLVPPPVPYVGLPTLQPSGGITSETTADAETTQTITEEDKIPASKRTKRPRGQGPPRRHRVQMREDTTKLCDWVQQQAGLREAPVFNTALAVAVEIIPTIRPLVYLEPRLLTRKGKRVTTGSSSADGEFERRNVERRLFQELSKYYSLRQDQSAWARQSLLSLVVEDLEGLSDLPGPSDQPPP